MNLLTPESKQKICYLAYLIIENVKLPIQSKIMIKSYIDDEKTTRRFITQNQHSFNKRQGLWLAISTVCI